MPTWQLFTQKYNLYLYIKIALMIKIKTVLWLVAQVEKNTRAKNLSSVQQSGSEFKSAQVCDPRKHGLKCRHRPFPAHHPAACRGPSVIRQDLDQKEFA